MDQNSSTRQMLMRRVQMYQFAVIEAALFLDSHPENQPALKYHNKYDKLLKEAQAEYVSRFGALNHSSTENEVRWNWVDDPWPWEIAIDSNVGEKGE